MAISVGSVEVDVIPNTRGVYRRLQAGLVPAATRAGADAGRAAGDAFGPAMQSQVAGLGLSIGRQIGQQIAGQITAAIRGAIRQGITQGGATARPAAARQGQQAGGEFARQMRAHIERALRAIPDITIGANTSEADADIQALRAQLEALANKRIGVDIDAAEARQQVITLEQELRRLGAAHPNPTVRADTAAALAQLRIVREEIDRISADPARVRVETDGTFGQRLRAAVQQAEASLPNINIDAATGEAEAEIASLRAQLTALRDVRVGIDMDSATALAKVEEIQARLARLAASDADVAVRVDSAAAQAQLAQVRAMITALDGKTANVNVNTRQAVRALLHLSIMIAAVPAIPAVPVIAAGLGSIVAAATAAGAGLGAFAAAAAPAFLDISKALQAQKSAQDAAATSAAKGGQTAARAARQSLQLAGAQQALAAAHRNAGRQISQAERGVTDAVRQAAENNTRAAEQVKSARRALADAVQQAAERQRAAAERVEQAEDALADAQQSARQAQLDLTQARKDAADELQDLSLRLADAQLSERDAALSVQEAQARLAKTKAAGSKADALDVARAQLAYDQAVQRLKEQQISTKRLTAEKKAADKAGVEGSDTVRRAQDALVAAQERVRDQAAGVAQAQQEASRQQAENAAAIVAAQGKVAEAQRNVSEVQRQGAESVARAQEQLVAAQESAADSIASAQRQIQSAQLSTAGSASQAATAQAKYQEALSKLTPSARGTFDAFVRLSGAFKEWSRSLQPQVMPIFTRALNGLKNSLPGLTPFVLAAARAISTLQDRVSRGFKSPWWKSFKTDLAGSVEPAIVGLGRALGNVFKVIGGIVDAFLPHMDSISTRMQDITGRWAKWATGLKGSPEFEGFLRYSSQQAPILAEGLGKIGGAFYDVTKALAPLSGPFLRVLGVLADGVADLVTTVPELVRVIYLVIIATKLWTLAVFLFNTVLNMNPIMRIILLIGILVTAVVYAYRKWGWFRTGVQAAWSGIKTAALAAWNFGLKQIFHGIGVGLSAIGTGAMWVWKKAIGPAFRGIASVGVALWNYGLKPVVTGIGAGFKLLGSVSMWLWKNAIGPAFKGIWTVAKVLLTVVAVLVVGPLVLAFRLLAAVGKWLWKNVLAPAFRGIGAVFSWLWRNILKPYVALIILQFKALAVIGKWLWRNVLAPAFRGIGAVAKWLWDKAIGPAFRGIASVAKWLWDKALRPAFDKIKKAVGLVAIAFRLAKDGIGKAWDKVKDLTKKPIKWVIDMVYNKGVVGLWNAAASVLPIKKLKKFGVKGWARGGVLPGYQSAKRDDVLTPMRRGEGVLVPEVVRGIGADTVHALNAAGNRGGVAAVRQAVGYARGGVVGFAEGGILGKIGSFIGNAKDWVLGGIAKIADATARPIRDLIKRIPGGQTGFGRMATALPTKVLNEALSFIKGSEQGEMGGAKVADALKWARSQAGKPYQWGGVGNPSWDCSGFLGGIQKVIEGKNPKGRIWSTFAFSGSRAPKGWKRGAASPFEIGITNRGKGHTAGTLGGVNVESRGGDGVLVGKRARGAYDRMFDARYGFLPARAGAIIRGSAQATARQMLGEFGWSQKQWPPLNELVKHESGWRWNAKNPSSGAYGLFQALPPSKMRSAGADWMNNPATQIKWGLGYIRSRYGSPAKAWSFWQRQSPHWYDSGGYLPEGLSLAYNGTGRPERVLTGAQERALMGAAVRGTDGSGQPIVVEVHTRDEALAGFIDIRVNGAQADLVRTIRAK